jgi:hypothetical protein
VFFSYFGSTIKPEMMKTSLKFITALLCFYFITTTAFAQKAKPDNTLFIGIWELYRMADNGQPLRPYPPGYIKIFNADGTFNIIRVQKAGSIIKQSGHYSIDDDRVYSEAIKAEDLVDKGIKISYEFSQDNTVLTIGYSYKDGSAFTEAYRKLVYSNEP